MLHIGSIQATYVCLKVTHNDNVQNQQNNQWHNKMRTIMGEYIHNYNYIQLEMIQIWRDNW